GLVRLQDQIDRLPRRFQRGIVERALRKGRRETGRDQEHVRSRRGTSSLSANFKTISRDGAARPVSTKLKCRAEISASPARSSWLKWRRCRHSRKWSPIWTGWLRSAC